MISPTVDHPVVLTSAFASTVSVASVAAGFLGTVTLKYCEPSSVRKSTTTGFGPGELGPVRKCIGGVG